MNLRVRLFIVCLLASIGLLAGCSWDGRAGVVEIVVYITATAGPSATSSPPPTVTPTPAPTFTPTATAPPVGVAGDPRAALLAPPVPQNGAPCGVVDVLDFPLDPPNAEGASGGGDFGVFRSRYDKYHAGEDWGLSSRSNFGVPVYSIGHGQVTYAEPLGWGVDQGVVIVRHSFSDGRSILSFYGHLDPPSVNLRAGVCVARGDKVGEIGRPRGRPHLHFEIRSQMPDLPGPGYWPVDPIRAGWEPPSRYIWEQRMSASPGVVWVGQVGTSLTVYLGLLDENTIAAVSDRKLIGVDLATGAVDWVLEGDEPVEAALLDTSTDVIYTINQLGDLAAYQWQEGPIPANGLLAPEDLDLRWAIELDEIGRPRLLPSPEGGVIVALSRIMIGVSAAGELRWRQEIASPILSWTQWGERLAFTLGRENAGLWAVGETAPARIAERVSGLPVFMGDQGYLYDPEGIYRWVGDGKPLEIVYVLPRAFPVLGDLLVYEGGEMLLAHTDRSDRRLVAFGPDGEWRWERSLAALPAGELQLALQDGTAYLLVASSNSLSRQVYLYAVDLVHGEILHLFTGGTRSAQGDDTWLHPLENGQLLIHLGGGSLVALDPAAARAALLPRE